MLMTVDCLNRNANLENEILLITNGIPDKMLASSLIGDYSIETDIDPKDAERLRGFLIGKGFTVSTDIINHRLTVSWLI